MMGLKADFMKPHLLEDDLPECSAQVSEEDDVDDGITVRVHGAHLLKDDLPECSAKVPVEDGVDDGVERRVHVAQPEGQLEGPARDGAGGAQGTQDVHDEEGKPACDEGTHDQTQDQRRPLLLLPRQASLLLLWVSRLGGGDPAHVDEFSLGLGELLPQQWLAQTQPQRLHHRAPGGGRGGQGHS